MAQETQIAFQLVKQAPTIVAIHVRAADFGFTRREYSAANAMPSFENANDANKVDLHDSGDIHRFAP